MFQPAVDGTIHVLTQGPAGCKPDAKLKALASWYKSLSDENRERVIEVVDQSAESAVFGFFVVLDGARVIEKPEDRGKLALWYEKDGRDTLLNYPKGESLHDLFNAKQP